MSNKEGKLLEQSHPKHCKSTKQNMMEKSFRIDDLLQRKTITTCRGSETEDLHKRRKYSDGSTDQVESSGLSLKEISPKRVKKSPMPMPVSLVSKDDNRCNNNNNLENSRNGSRSSSVTDVGSLSDTSLMTSSPYSAFSVPSFYENSQHPHLMNPLQLQLNSGFFGAHSMSTSSPSLLPNPYTSTVTSVGSGQPWNNHESPAGLSHLGLFPNLMLPSHHLMMHANQHPAISPSVWSHPFLTGHYIDPRGSERSHHSSTFLNRLASSYGVTYGNGQGMNPLLNIGSKRKGGQIRFSNSQTAQLEKAFFQYKYLDAKDRKKLAHSLGLSDRQVKTWFQNRRAKWRKLKNEKDGSPFNEQNDEHSDESFSPDPDYASSNNGETSQTHQRSSSHRHND